MLDFNVVSKEQVGREGFRGGVLGKAGGSGVQG